MQLAICWSRSSHLHLLRQKSNCSSHIVTQFMDVFFWRHSYHNTIIKFTGSYSELVTHSSVLLTSCDTPAPVWHLR